MKEGMRALDRAFLGKTPMHDFVNLGDKLPEQIRQKLPRRIREKIPPWKSYYERGYVTREKPEGPLYLPRDVRYERAQTLKKIQQAQERLVNGEINVEDFEVYKKELINEARARKKVARDFLTQGRLERSDGVSAQYTILEPPENRRTKEYQNLPPVVLIPGVANDLEAVGTLAQELAVQGRKVIVIAHPDSNMGKVTKKFAQEIQNASDYTPHARFFKSAIEAICGKNEDIELWGFSIGAPIVAKLLNDPKIQQRTIKAALISPSSVINLNAIQAQIGGLKAMQDIITESDAKFLRWTFTAGNKDKPPFSEVLLKLSIINALGKLNTKKSPDYESMRVKEGGQIAIFSTGNDKLTYCGAVFNDQTKDLQREANPQINILYFPDKTHAAPIIEPGFVVQVISSALNNPTIPPPKSISRAA